MAALVAGEKARMFALGGVARGGATRGGYRSPKLFISIGGVQLATGRLGAGSIDDGSLTISHVRGVTPNTCQFIVRGFTPSVGSAIVITLGSINNLTREFGGLILSQDVGYVGTPANGFITVYGIDPSWLANQQLVSGQWINTSASVIAAALLPLGYTGHNIQLDLPVLDTFSYANQAVADVLAQLVARFGGTAFFDYLNDLHCFATVDPAMLTDPMPLTATHPSLQSFLATSDLSQIVTRCFVEGGGVTALASCGVGETILPIAAVAWYAPNAGVVVCGQQRITYSGMTQAQPATAPTGALVIGTGLTAGVYQYAYTDVTASGESLPSPLGNMTTGLLPAPNFAPFLAVDDGTTVDAGVHKYGVTFITAAGETLASPVASVTTSATTPLPAPSSDMAYSYGGGGALTPNSYYGYVTTFVDVHGGETLGTRGDHPFYTAYLPVGDTAIGVSLDLSPHASCVARKLYRSLSAGGGTAAVYGPWYLCQTISDNTTTFVIDDLADASLGAATPGSNTAIFDGRAVSLTFIAQGPTGVTARNLYRTIAGGSQLKLVTTIANNTTSIYADSTADAGLGANAPTVGTAAVDQVALAGIMPGPAGTTSRNVYRTPVGDVQLKLLATLADNTTTTYTDSTADGSLGANAPTTDTSGLSASALTTTSGATSAGATTLTVASAALFAAAGGWALIASTGLGIRYTGKGATQLTGIPATGPGSIVTAIPSGAVVQGTLALTGIPASGPGSVVYPITQGDPIHALAQVDDLAAQAALSTLLDPSNLFGGARGIREQYLPPDSTIGYTEAYARGLAEIALRKQIDVKVAYTCQDANSRTGRLIAVNLPLQGVVATFKISQVDQTGHTPALNPIYTVQAGARFSFEQLLQGFGG